MLVWRDDFVGSSIFIIVELCRCCDMKIFFNLNELGRAKTPY
jgi:hypothetical protein